MQCNATLISSRLAKSISTDVSTFSPNQSKKMPSSSDRLTDLPFLRGELEQVDPKLPSLIAAVRSDGAGECWHRYGSFLDHLTDIYKILKLWKERGAFDAWRRKLNSIVPADGVVVKHIKTGEDLRVSRSIVAVFLMMTIADCSEQLFRNMDVLTTCCDSERAEEFLSGSIERNPFVGEPRVVLGQYLGKGRFEEAQEGLRRLLEWGSPLDKRMGCLG